MTRLQIKFASIIAVTVGISGILISCGTPTTSNLKHTIDQPVRATFGAQWASMSLAQYKKDIIAPNLPTAEVLPADHSLVQRAKFWVDKLDRKIRATYPQQMAQVPKLNTSVIREEGPNAFISSTFGCFDLAASFQSPVRQSPVRPNTINAVYLDLNTGMSYQWPSTMNCVAQPNIRALKAALRAFNSSHTDCQFTLVENKIQISNQCPMADTAGITGSRRIVIRQIANWVTITSGLFKKISSEAAFIAVVGHELGHYYRAHGLADKSDYGYYYKISERNPTQKPVKDLLLQGFGEKAYEAASTASILDKFATIPNQEIAPSLYLAAGDLAHIQCLTNLGACSTSCKQVSQRVGDQDFIDAMGMYPFKAPRNSGAYFAFEADVKGCLETIRYDTRDPQSWNKILASIKTPVWSPLKASLSRQGVGVLLSRVEKAASLVKQPPRAQNLLDIIRSISRQLNQDEKLAYNVLTLARQQQLGQYTIEQESDELAAEWLDLIGIRPKSVGTSFLLLGLNSKGGLGGNLLKGRTCQDLRDNGWRDSSGNDVFIPIGNYSEIHHSTCFRAFNADRDVLTHRYQTTRDRIFAPGVSWQEIQIAAMNLTNSRRGNPPVAARLRPPNTEQQPHSIPVFDHSIKSCMFSNSLF